MGGRGPGWACGVRRMTVEIINEDCKYAMTRMANEGRFADLIFADPPFNIGYEYDVYEDRKTLGDYIAFTEVWMYWATRILKPDGTMWVAAPDEYVHRFRIVMEDKWGMHLKSHVIWHYTFGVNRKKGFTRSHAHLLYYVKDRKDFVWNGDAVKVPSRRQLSGDKRAAPGGRHPDDTWRFPRICGTHKERVGWHGCQMPEALTARIVRASSDQAGVVLDPFLGSGTTGAVAKKLGRDFIGIELSGNYAAKAKGRIDGVREGDPIQGEGETRDTEARP